MAKIPLKLSAERNPDAFNLDGQRLGRKGMETRERILGAMLKLMAAPPGEPVTLTAVAKEASVGMTTLYLYFPDMGDLLIAALDRSMEGANEAFIDHLRTRWTDEDLAEECQEFGRAHCEFWRKNAGVLHLRNSFADSSDHRLIAYRWQVSMPVIDLLIQQMDGDPKERDDRLGRDLASVLLSGVERVAALVTHRNFYLLNSGSEEEIQSAAQRLVQAQAKLLELAIANQRRSKAA